MPHTHSLSLRRALMMRSGACVDLPLAWSAAAGLRGRIPNRPILGPDGQLLVSVSIEENGRLLVGRWHGHCTAEMVQYGMLRMLPTLERYRCVAVLSDGSAASGDWSELLPWMQYELLPRVVRAGVRFAANVRGENPASRLAHQEYAHRAGRYLGMRLFDDTATARAWLQQMLNR